MKVHLVGGGRLLEASHRYDIERESIAITARIEKPWPDPEKLQWFDIYLDGHFFYRTPTDVSKWPQPDALGVVRVEFTIGFKGQSAKDGRMGL